MGLPMARDMYVATQELEAVLRQPYTIHRTIEFNMLCTGAQFMQMLGVWQKMMHSPIQVLSLPKSPKLKHRRRKLIPLRDIESEAARVAVDVMWDEIEDRLMTRAPSKSRMVQLYMSKQMDVTDAIPSEWANTAKAYYMAALRSAESTKQRKQRANTTRTSPRKHPGSQTQRSKGVRHVSLFQVQSGSPAGSLGAALGTVAEEVKLWAATPQATVEAYRDPETELVNEFQLAYDMREKCPLHYFVFKQCGSHRGTEAKCEQIFSIAKHFTDPNMHPGFLRHLVKLSANKAKYKPSWQQVWKLYQSKFRHETNYELDHSSDSELGGCDTSSSSSSDSE